MKIRMVGIDLSVDRCVRSARRLGALGALILGASGALAQSTFSISTPAGQFNSPGSADATGGAARFNNPQSVTVDSAFNTYIADTENHTIRKMTAAGVVTTVAGLAGTSGNANGTGPVGVTNGTARFKNPQGVAVNPAGTTLYVADTGNHLIRVIDLTASPANVTTLAGAGVQGHSDLTGTSAEFNFPSGIAFDGTNLYVADTTNQSIRKIIVSTGAVSTLAGPDGAPGSTNPAGTPGNVNATGPAARFFNPFGVAVDNTRVFVADKGNNSIRVVTIATGAVNLLAGLTSGVAGNVDSSTGPATAASFSGPGGVAVDSTGSTAATTVFVADSVNSTIRRIALSNGVVSTVAGAAGISGFADGIGSAARFSGPLGIALDSAGNFYVGDTLAQLIRKGVAATAPAITSANGATFSVGSAGTFTVTATGAPAPTFSITSGTLPTGVTLNATTGVISGTPTSAGSFPVTIQASNGVTPAATQAFTLTVRQAPQITSADNTSFAVNTAGSFQFVATGSPAPTFSITAGSLPSSVAILSSGGLLTAAPPSSTSGSPFTFTVTATNSAGSNSQVFTLTVNTTSPPSIGAQPQPQTVAAGATTASFSVTASANPAISSYQWQRQIGGTGSFVAITDGAATGVTFSGATTATLSLTNVAPSLNGDVFHVIVTNATGSTTSSPATLTVLGTVPTASAPTSVAADVGQNVSFTSTTTGNPAPTLHWQRQAGGTTTFVDLTESAPYSGTTTNTLSVTGITANMNGDHFRLVATNAHGVVPSTAASLTINSVVPIITAAPQNTTVSIGQNASFTVIAAGSPVPSLRWQRQPAGSFAGFSDLSDDGTYSGTASNTLTVISPSIGMSGDQFQVVATNTNGSVVSAIATLTVSATVPTISANPAAAIVNVGDNVTFSANATGTPAPTLRWQRQPSGTSGFVDLGDDSIYTGTTTTTLTVTGVTAGMSGDVFRLVATNAAGSAPSATALLTVNLGTTITTFAGQATVAGSVDGLGINARLSSPACIVVDVAGTFYIADTGSSVIRKMTASGVVTTLAGLAGSRGSVDGTGNEARFNSPTGIAVDGAGNVYVADTFNHTIRVVSPTGVVSTLAGSPSSSGSVDGVGSAARFFLPGGIAVSAGGTLYVADSANHTIRRITTDRTVSTFAGAPGASGFVDNAIGTSARFSSPNSLVVDNSGTLFVADSQNNAIRKVTASGSVSTLAGSPSATAGSADGTGTSATFNHPSGLAVDNLGNVFVADTNNHLIRKITSTGEVTTLAGLAGNAGVADGNGNAARFNRPFGIAVDSNGNLYIADTGSHTIRRSGTTTAAQIVTQPTHKSAGIGQTVSFSVVATGSPAPTSFQWQRQAAGDFGFSNLSNDLTYSGVTTTTLTLRNATSLMHGDQFRVIVNNGVNPAATSDAATLTIGVAPIFTSAASATFQAGQANIFTVTAESTPAATFTAGFLPPWATFDSTSGILSGTPTDTTGSPFTITWIASNGVSATQTFTLTVLPANLPPSITTQPANITVDQGQTATFNVAVSGTPPFTYQWRRNGISIAGANGATLTLSNVQAANAGSYSVVVTNGVSTATSGNAELTVNTVPVITSQPHAQIATAGGSATFTVAATGGSSFSYQWRKNGAPIAGANGSTLSLSNISAGDAGNYDVTVSNSSGSVGSSLAQLTVVTAATAPVITVQPASKTVLAGTPSTLSIAATGAPAPTYQWRKDGAPISGANSATYAFSNAQAGDAANYDVVVSNSAGSVTSSAATLRVIVRSYAGVYFGTFSSGLGGFALYVRDDNTGVFLGYLPGSTAPVMSLSLSLSDSGQFSFNQAPILGASSVGDEPSRAAALSSVTVNGSIANDGSVSGSMVGGANASLAGTRASDTGATQGLAGFYRAGATNGATSVYTIAGANGQAFAVIQSGANSDGGSGSVSSSGQVNVLSNRSIISGTINAGSGLITGSATGGVVVASFNGASDAVLARQRLVNISSRARVATGDSVAIAGFVISGEESKPVLIRAVGPTLGAAPFNISSALASPRLELHRIVGSTATSLAVNTGIGANRVAIDAAGVQAGAFTLGAAGTDAAILTTLAPGNYTATVSSTTSAAGVALVEVYDLSAPTTGQKLLNISTRAAAGTADNTLIAGFVVPPGAPKRVLVRGVGPGLTPFGVAGVLAQPVLSLTNVNGNSLVAQNTNWNTSPDAATITASSQQVGAFGLANNDSALVVTLMPGNYTAQVVGAGGTTGIAIIEVYELP